MKKVNLDFEIKDLNGNKIANAGELVAGFLMSEVKGDAVKFFDWAMLFNKKEVVSMDSSDLIKIKTLISETEKMTILAKAPIIKYLETIK
jgi:hypothetical protein